MQGTMQRISDRYGVVSLVFFYEVGCVGWSVCWVGVWVWKTEEHTRPVFNAGNHAEDQ